MVGRYEPKRYVGYRVYINAKEAELLHDMLQNDVNFSDYDENREDKEKLIDKLIYKGE